MKYNKYMFISIILAISGGFMNTYSYICNGGVFASMQTGNILLLTINITNGNISGLLQYICPLILFIVGIIISSIINKYDIMILFEVMILIIVCYIENNIIASSLISIVCGVQLNGFGAICNNTTTMCTGNLRYMIKYLCSYALNRDISTLHKSITSCLLVSSFVIGTIIGNITIQYIHKYALLICSDILLVAFIIMLFDKCNNKTT